jgi:hypothetical protein
LKEGDALSPLLFNFALEYTIRKVKENQLGLKLNGLQLQVSADDINLMGDNIKINVEPVMPSSKKLDIEVN